MSDFTLFGKDILLLDGAMGTMLQERGLPPGTPPEAFNATHPETVREIHRQYLSAGADLITANSFGINPLHYGDDCEAMTAAALRTGREAGAARLALDIGPLGTLMEPLGSLSFEEAYAHFARIVRAGWEADCVIIETMSDLYECKAALLAVKENSDLPVLVSLSFEAEGRSFLGADPLSAVTMLEALGADAVGLNCSLGPAQALPLVKEFLAAARIPVILRPNAGLPDPDGKPCHLPPEDFAAQMLKGAQMGARVLGGCCGTSPAHIAALRKALDAMEPPERSLPPRRARCSSGTKTFVLGEGAALIGERINPTGKKRMQTALREQNFAYLSRIAAEEEAAGCDILDINVGLPGTEEAELLPRAVREIQGVTDLPLQLDSADPAALEAALRVVRGRPIVNSVNGKCASLESVLPLCRKYGAMVIGLTLDEDGIPAAAEGRIAIAKRIVAEAERQGLSREDVLIDCLTLTVSAQREESFETLRALRMCKELGFLTVLGVSNVSFGLPDRPLLGSVFLAGALGAGLDACIADPLSERFRETLDAWRVLDGSDPGAARYIERHSTAGNTAAPPPAAGSLSLREAVLRGLAKEAEAAVKARLQHETPLTLIDGDLIPALDEVGALYDQKKLFLPQLLRAAGAAQSAFALLREALGEQPSGEGRGAILLATVKGDIHDIGKNIARMLLENYGYSVRDLGRDVAPARIVEEIERGGYRLCGLSALMTTTVGAMAETITLARARGLDCRFMVGGAVLTEDYARSIGADYYARDARAGVRIAGELFGT